MRTEQIGNLAGIIWRYLESNGAAKANKIKKEIAITDKQMFDMAIGWLARENKIKFEDQTKNPVITIS